MKSIGIVLSGGGARAAVHLGVLKALEELNIKLSAISGVSAGAVIGALYAAGISPRHILDELKEQSYFSVRDFAWKKNGMFTMDSLRKKLEELIGNDNFGSLHLSLFVNATDILTGSLITFSHGPLYDAVLASASVPVIFEPIHFNGHQLLDGGVLNNLPVEPLLDKCDVIIGSHANKLYDGNKPIRIDNVSIVDQCFHLVVANSVRQRARECHIFIEPLLEGYGIFDMKHADKIFEIGYMAAMEHKEKLLAIRESRGG